MVAVGPDMPAAIRDLAFEFSVEFDDKATRVLDYAGGAADPTLLQLRVPGQQHPVVQFRGIAQRYAAEAALFFSLLQLLAGNGLAMSSIHGVSRPHTHTHATHNSITRRNPLAHAWLAAPATAFSDLPASDKPLGELATAGSAEVLLASALQTRNNSRLVFLGSAFDGGLLAGEAGKGTVEFLRHTAEWVHGVAGNVQILSTLHHRVGETRQHGIYRIKDTLVGGSVSGLRSGVRWAPYMLTLRSHHPRAHPTHPRPQEYHATLATVGADGSQRPFAVDDLQLEVVMLDPYVRTTLLRDDRTNKVGPSTYSTTFTLPDVHGVYTFKLNYRRHGVSWLTHTQTIQVRPFRHNEYPRFLTQAYPYYAGVFSQFAAFLLFAALWMYHRDAKKGESAAAKASVGKAV